MRNIIIMDLDGTLADGRHRLHLLPKADMHLTESWLEFNQASVDDEPITNTIEIMNALRRAGYFIIILTGRSNHVEVDTREWLRRNRCSYDVLWMRDKNDNRKDTVIKEEFLRNTVGLDRIVACYDDSPNVISHLRGMGLTVYAVTDYGDNAHKRTDLHSHGVEVYASDDNCTDKGGHYFSLGKCMNCGKYKD